MDKDINEISFLATGWVFEVLIDDTIWTNFGFEGKPKRGKLFDFLVSKERLRLEKFLMNEVAAMSIVDVAQAAKSLDTYKMDTCDYRSLLLCGLFYNLWKIGIRARLDEILSTTKEVNEYTSDSAGFNIPKKFTERLFQKSNHKGFNYSKILYGASSLLASANRENGILTPNNSYKKELKKFTPFGELRCKNLKKEQTNKIIETTTCLLYY